MEVVAVDVLAEGPHGFDADGFVVGELDPYRADGWGGGGGRGVFLDHFVGGVGLEGEFAAPGGACCVS